MIGRVPRHVRRQATVLGRVDDGCRHREVEATPLLRQLGRREVDGHLAAGKLEAAVVDGNFDALASLLERPVAESHDVKPGEPIGDIRFHLDPNAVEAEDRPRQGPGQHHGDITRFCICASA